DRTLGGRPDALRTIRSKQGEYYALKPWDIVTLRVKGFTIKIIITPEACPPQKASEVLLSDGSGSVQFSGIILSRPGRRHGNAGEEMSSYHFDLALTKNRGPSSARRSRA